MAIAQPSGSQAPYALQTAASTRLPSHLANQSTASWTWRTTLRRHHRVTAATDLDPASGRARLSYEMAVAPDGSAIRVPPGRARPHRRGITPEAGGWYGHVLEADERSWRELATAEPICIPAYARPLFAAHLAYRRKSGAASTDPYFAHPRDPANKPATDVLRAAIRSTAQRIGLDLPWLHGDDCRYGADIGLTWRGRSWLGERGLVLARTGPGQDQTITPPRPIVPARPQWISDGPA